MLHFSSAFGRFCDPNHCTTLLLTYELRTGPLEIYDNLRREDKKNPKTFQSFYQDFCLNLKRLIFEHLNRNRLPV